MGEGGKGKKENPELRGAAAARLLPERWRRLFNSLACTALPAGSPPTRRGSAAPLRSCRGGLAARLTLQNGRRGPLRAGATATIPSCPPPPTAASPPLPHTHHTLPPPPPGREERGDLLGCEGIFLGVPPTLPARGEASLFAGPEGSYLAVSEAGGP